jgi:pimeloyl-ACP methyl ester carboxylesterase
MVCLHGLGASSSSFDDLRKSSHLEGYEFVTPDCPGHAKALQQMYHGEA